MPKAKPVQPSQPTLPLAAPDGESDDSEELVPDMKSATSKVQHGSTRCTRPKKRDKSDIQEDHTLLTEEDKANKLTFSYLSQKAQRKEATATEKRQLKKQFDEAKQAEYQSWLDNEVFELVDMRKLGKIKNYVTGPWVLTIKRYKDGNFLKAKARLVLRGFQDRQKDSQQTDSPAASRPGFRLAVQMAANN